MRDFNRIFILGLPRTGTNSLCRYLRTEGINCAVNPSARDFTSKGIVGFCGASVVMDFEKLDHRFPTSLFIHPIRTKDAWLFVTKNYLENIKFTSEFDFLEEQLKKIYFVNDLKPDNLELIYDRHYKRVEKYFKDRPQDLLTLNLCGGDPPSKLMDFLRLPMLSGANVFPNEKDVYD